MCEPFSKLKNNKTVECIFCRKRRIFGNITTFKTHISLKKIVCSTTTFGVAKLIYFFVKFLAYLSQAF